MPTTRPRHLVTETDDLALALNATAARWPELSRPQLLVRLALEGHRAIGQTEEAHRRRRLAAIARHSGALTGIYGRDYVAALRGEWPP